MLEHIRDPGERVRALCQYGCKVDVDPSIHAKRYFRSGLEMVRMANYYADDGDWESAFVLYSKFITLFVEKLPKHPTYKSPEITASERAINKKKVAGSFKLAEVLKEKLRARYTKEEAIRQEEEKRRKAQLAIEEKKRKEEEEKRRKKLEQIKDEETRKRMLLEEQLRLEQEAELRRLQEQELERLHQQRLQEEEEAARLAAGMGSIVIRSSIPAGPPGAEAPPPAYGQATLITPLVPDRDLKPGVPTPSVDRSTKPNHFTSTGTYTQNKYGLRDVIAPSDIVAKFLALAEANTSRNVETLGLLLGKIKQNAFHITHVLVPRQSGTPDSCDMEGEEEVFLFQDSNDLITIGWIHTHPSQTAFLSSVDLHVHFPYQQLLPEAIAIVCSAKYQETGYFTITPEHGMKVIGQCKERGFHYHQKEPPLFEECGHAKVNESTVSIVDLRK